MNFRTVDRWASSAIAKGLIEKMSGRTPTEASVIERLKDLWFNNHHIDDVAAALDKTRKIMRVMSGMADEANSRYDCFMRINDFVSGMTDRFALDLFRKLRGISI